MAKFFNNLIGAIKSRLEKPQKDEQANIEIFEPKHDLLEEHFDLQPIPHPADFFEEHLDLHPTPLSTEEAVAEFGSLSDEELDAKVNELYQGFEEANKTKRMFLTSHDIIATKVSFGENFSYYFGRFKNSLKNGFNRFKINFSIKFDEFASGAMLEAATKKVGKGVRAFATRFINLKNRVSFAVIKALAFLALPFIKMAIKRKANPKPPKPDGRVAVATKTFFSYQKSLIIRGEAKVSSHMASFMTQLDKSTGTLGRNTAKLAYRGVRGAYKARDWADFHKKKLLAVLFVLMSCGIAAVSIVNYFTAYIYAYNGKPLGMVKSQDDVLRVLDIVNTQLSREHGTDIEIDGYLDITFHRVVSLNANDEIHGMQDVFNRLTYMQDISIRAYALYLEGRRIAVLDSEERIESVLEDYKRLHFREIGVNAANFESVEILEELEIFQFDTQLGRIEQAGAVLDRIQIGTMAERIHVVERGQTFNGIAQMHGLTPAELLAANPDVTPARLSIDQEIILQQAVPLLTVQTVEVAKFIEPIPYETEFEDNPNAFRGEQTTRVAGIPGEREVTARIIRNNGIQIEREDIGVTVLKEASTAIVVRGTREPPPREGTGRLIHPLRSGRLTSTFGMRWGRMHNGIDLAAPRGTRVIAADGGTVTFSGYRGAMGNLIIINHGGGIETYYAHLNRRHVSRGDRVFQGQHIGDVGSTGRSTGPHLHFEVHVNGRPQNPFNFIPR